VLRNSGTSISIMQVSALWGLRSWQRRYERVLAHAARHLRSLTFDRDLTGSSGLTSLGQPGAQERTGRKPWDDS
jgi:hypothetical protein